MRRRGSLAWVLLTVAAVAMASLSAHAASLKWRCPVCGQEFLFPPGDYAYRDRFEREHMKLHGSSGGPGIPTAGSGEEMLLKCFEMMMLGAMEGMQQAQQAQQREQAQRQARDLDFRRLVESERQRRLQIEQEQRDRLQRYRNEFQFSGGTENVGFQSLSQPGVLQFQSLPENRGELQFQRLEDDGLRPGGTAFFGLGGDSGSAPPDLRDAPNDGSSATALQVAAQTPPQTGEFVYTGDEKPRVFYPQYTAEQIVDVADRKRIGQLLEKWKNQKMHMREDHLAELPAVEESRTRYVDAKDPHLRDRDPLAKIERDARKPGDGVLDGVKYLLVGTLGRSSPLGRGLAEAVSDMREIWDGYGKFVTRSADKLLAIIKEALDEAAGLTGGQVQQDRLSDWIDGTKTGADDNATDALGRGIQKKAIRNSVDPAIESAEVFDRF